MSGVGVAANSIVDAIRLTDHFQSYAGIEDAEIAVFRFTLGIPGFDDALIPRVVGSLGAALLIANHLSDPAQATDAQARSLLFSICINGSCSSCVSQSCSAGGSCPLLEGKG